MLPFLILNSFKEGLFTYQNHNASVSFSKQISSDLDWIVMCRIWPIWECKFIYLPFILVWQLEAHRYNRVCERFYRVIHRDQFSEAIKY